MERWFSNHRPTQRAGGAKHPVEGQVVGGR